MHIIVGIMEKLQLVELGIRIVLIIEVLIFAFYSGTYYFLFTSDLRNGLFKGLSFYLISGMVFSCVIILTVLLVLANKIEIYSISGTPYLVLGFIIARTVVLCAKFNLAHQVRKTGNNLNGDC